MLPELRHEMRERGSNEFDIPRFHADGWHYEKAGWIARDREHIKVSASVTTNCNVVRKIFWKFILRRKPCNLTRAPDLEVTRADSDRAFTAVGLEKKAQIIVGKVWVVCTKLLDRMKARTLVEFALG